MNPKSAKKNKAAAGSTSMRPDRLSDQISTGGLTLSTDSPVQSTRHTPKRQKSSPVAPPYSLDAEGLFEFEGSDGVASLPSTDVEDSDKEAKGSIAKSLPMNIPAFMSKPRDSIEDLDDIPQDDNVDIAASIKALAKSVHGDAVFGDLPRPRFSTQI
ncbi:hypothetical protein NQ314_015289 [Rhamnusium bicolor]|uniref:Uncharacterized protein n=1 Tax=Rhamnusium bicolor TaxID=1586634 RepID=A0AAV8WZ46_9CUCU|nr:hypothetical protein NQ314_015289 [Rhamnusium bicolor]